MDGKAMNKSKKAGRSVQMVSISCPSIMNLLNSFDPITDKIMYIVMTVMRIKTIIAWSWKKRSCSMLGEVES